MSEKQKRDKQSKLTPKEIEMIQEINETLSQNQAKIYIREEIWEQVHHKLKIRCQENGNVKHNQEFLEIKILIAKNFGVNIE